MPVHRPAGVPEVNVSALFRKGKSPAEEQVRCSWGLIGPDLLLGPQSAVLNEFMDPDFH